MYTQTASLLHHTDKSLYKCRVLLGKLSKFIDDNKKVWQGFRDCEILWIQPHSLVLCNILCIRLAQTMLSSLQLALESNQCSLCKSPAQIRHYTNCVGYLFKWFEGSATFKVLMISIIILQCCSYQARGSIVKAQFPLVALRVYVIFSRQSENCTALARNGLFLCYQIDNRNAQFFPQFQSVRQRRMLTHFY